MLRWSIFTSPVTEEGILLDSRNAATTIKSNVICTTTILNDRNYSEYVLHTHSLLIISASTETRHFVAVAALRKYVRCWMLILYIASMSRI